MLTKLTYSCSNPKCTTSWHSIIVVGKTLDRQGPYMYRQMEINYGHCPYNVLVILPKNLILPLQCTGSAHRLTYLS